MIPVEIVALASIFYFILLFAVAYYADKRRAAGRSIISNSHIYSLSIAVYFTSWTFYGSVGRAATTGLDFLPIYLGPTLIAFSWWFLLAQNGADQQGTEYRQHCRLHLQPLWQIGLSRRRCHHFRRTRHHALYRPATQSSRPHLRSPHVSAGERRDHGATELISDSCRPILTRPLSSPFFLVCSASSSAPGISMPRSGTKGLVAAIALESLVKIVAFVGVGIYVTYGLFDGFTDIFERFLTEFPDRQYLLRLGTPQTPYAMWFTLTFISMMAVMFLPRQFHIMVVENSAEKTHRRRHVALSRLHVPDQPVCHSHCSGGLLSTMAEPPTPTISSCISHCILAIHGLALLVFIGGFSASAGMVMV